MRVIQAPLDLVEAVADLHLPPRADRRLQDLMGRNNNGLLTEAERGELDSLVETSQNLSLLRARAMQLLGRSVGSQTESGPDERTVPSRGPCVSAAGLPPDPPGHEFFSENRVKYPPELLLPYANQHIAWSADGTKLLAGAPTWDELEEKLIAMGIRPNQVVFEYIPNPDDVYL